MATNLFQAGLEAAAKRPSVCWAISDQFFICNEMPDHEGDHVASAFGREIQRWANEEHHDDAA